MRVHGTLRMAACTLLAGSLTAGAANANLIINGDFSTGLTGWTSAGSTSAEASGSTILSGAMNFAVIGDGPSGMHSLHQDFDVPIEDHKLTVTFDFGFSGANTASLFGDMFESFIDIQIGGSSTSFQNLSLTLIGDVAGMATAMFDISGADAPSHNARLSFLVDNQSGLSFAELDNVVVTAQIQQQSVPEPETWALFGIGLIGLRYLRRRHIA